VKRERTADDDSDNDDKRHVTRATEIDDVTKSKLIASIKRELPPLSSNSSSTSTTSTRRRRRRKRAHTTDTGDAGTHKRSRRRAASTTPGTGGTSASASTIGAPASMPLVAQPIAIAPSVPVAPAVNQQELALTLFAAGVCRLRVRARVCDVRV
jgi:hypothetical protein